MNVFPLHVSIKTVAQNSFVDIKQFVITFVVSSFGKLPEHSSHSVESVNETSHPQKRWQKSNTAIYFLTNIQFYTKQLLAL